MISISYVYIVLRVVFIDDSISDDCLRGWEW